jgi:methionyl-tRNA synthetase
MFPFFLIVLGVFCGQAVAQQSAPTLPRHPDVTSQDSAGNERVEQVRKGMEKRANKERELQLKRDTDQLLKLSTELKQYVDKTDQNLLSLDVIKKAEEIEKLAHSVKEKMKGN